MLQPTDEPGTSTATLANGVRVVLKPTDFKADEVVFGGFSLVVFEDDDLRVGKRVVQDLRPDAGYPGTWVKKRFALDHDQMRQRCPGVWLWSHGSKG